MNEEMNERERPPNQTLTPTLACSFAKFNVLFILSFMAGYLSFLVRQTYLPYVGSYVPTYLPGMEGMPW